MKKEFQREKTVAAKALRNKREEHVTMVGSSVWLEYKPFDAEW